MCGVAVLCGYYTVCLCGVTVLYGYYVCVEWLFSMGTMCLCGVAVLYGCYVSVWSGCSLWVLCVCVERLFSMGNSMAKLYHCVMHLRCETVPRDFVESSRVV